MPSWQSATGLFVALCLLQNILGLSVILNNDDGFASAQIREAYRLLTEAGHNAWIVAPAYDQSGRGGTLKFAGKANLTTSIDPDVILKGEPSFGHDPNYPKIWYYDGTPAVCTFFALDYVVPNFFNGSTPDLFINGPNFGTNLGDLMYTMSGTMAATYSAIGRGIPAISLSATAYGPSRGYQSINQTTATRFPDPATIIGNLTLQLVGELASGAQGKRLLPPGYGLSVNFPKITSFEDLSCIYPPFVRTRLTGSAASQKAVFDPKTGLFHGENIVTPDGVNSCINGNCDLPGESFVVNNPKLCQSSVSIFTIDYDAPENTETRGVLASLEKIVTDQKNAKNYSEATVGSPPPQQETWPKTTSGAVVSKKPSPGTASGGMDRFLMRCAVMYGVLILWAIV